MAALSCLWCLCRKKRDVAGRCLFPVAVAILAAGAFLASCADANSSDFAGFRGEADDWVGNCPAQLAVGMPTAGMIDATLIVLCDQKPAVEETMTGAYVPNDGHYHAVVTGIRTTPSFDYDQDKNFDLTLISDGCIMSGTVTDANGSSNISFNSLAQNCP